VTSRANIEDRLKAARCSARDYLTMQGFKKPSLDAPDVALVQYYSGTIVDGIPGPRSRMAIEAWFLSMGVPDELTYDPTESWLGRHGGDLRVPGHHFFSTDIASLNRAMGDYLAAKSIGNAIVQVGVLQYIVLGRRGPITGTPTAHLRNQAIAWMRGAGCGVR